jgi:hypothetical protein
MTARLIAALIAAALAGALIAMTCPAQTTAERVVAAH